MMMTSVSVKNCYSCHLVQLFDPPVVKSYLEDSMVKNKRALEREVRGY